MRRHFDINSIPHVPSAKEIKEETEARHPFLKHIGNRNKIAAETKNPEPPVQKISNSDAKRIEELENQIKMMAGRQPANHAQQELPPRQNNNTAQFYDPRIVPQQNYASGYHYPNSEPSYRQAHHHPQNSQVYPGFRAHLSDVGNRSPDYPVNPHQDDRPADLAPPRFDGLKIPTGSQIRPADTGNMRPGNRSENLQAKLTEIRQPQVVESRVQAPASQHVIQVDQPLPCLNLDGTLDRDRNSRCSEEVVCSISESQYDSDEQQRLARVNRTTHARLWNQGQYPTNQKGPSMSYANSKGLPQVVGSQQRIPAISTMPRPPFMQPTDTSELSQPQASRAIQQSRNLPVFEISPEWQEPSQLQDEGLIEEETSFEERNSQTGVGGRLSSDMQTGFSKQAHNPELSGKFLANSNHHPARQNSSRNSEDLSQLVVENEFGNNSLCHLRDQGIPQQELIVPKELNSQLARSSRNQQAKHFQVLLQSPQPNQSSYMMQSSTPSYQSLDRLERSQDTAAEFLHLQDFQGQVQGFSLMDESNPYN